MWINILERCVILQLIHFQDVAPTWLMEGSVSQTLYPCLFLLSSKTDKFETFLQSIISTFPKIRVK